MKPLTIFINSGHSIYDPGARRLVENESKLNIELRDKVVDVLQGFQVLSVPDNLNLRQSIDWINERADVNDIAFSIHLNANNDTSIGGTEAYYYNDRERQMAEIFSRCVSESINVKNRGAKPDSQTWIGSLGWIRKLKCDSVLVEVCYLTNKEDMEKYTAYDASLGFKDAVLEIVPRKDTKEAEKLGREADLIKLQSEVNILWKIVAILQSIINILRGKN